MKRRVAAGAALLPLALAGAWWSVQPEPWTARTPAAASTVAAARPAAGPPAAPHAPLPAGDGWMTPALRQQLDALWLDAPDARAPEDLKAQLLAAAARHFPAPHLTRARELIARYVDYRVALARLKPPADMNDPRALQAALQARTRVRQAHFTEEEYETLFAQEDAFDRFTIARLEILRHPDLTAQQRATALRDAESALADRDRAARAQAVLHDAVAAQTARFEAAGVSDGERHAQRRAAWGEEAAQRLAQLDAEERQWQARLAQFESAPPQQREQLRHQWFTPEEQLRLPAALQMRAAAK